MSDRLKVLRSWRINSQIKIVIILMALVIPLCSCSNGALKTGLRDYLSAIVTQKTEGYHQEIATSTGQLQQRGQLNSRKLELEKTLSLCWRECHGTWGGDCYDFCSKPISPRDTLHSGTGYYVTDEYGRFEYELNKVKEQLRYLDSIELIVQGDEKSIAAMEAINSSLNTNYNKWDVKQIGTEIFSITGDGLGWLDKGPCTASWYYYGQEKAFKPADIYSQELDNRLKWH
jgi:hypothetical protein